MELARALQIMRRLESESQAVQERMKSLENYLASQDKSASRMAVLEASVRDLESRLLNCESIMPKLTSLEVRIARLAALHEQMTNLESRLNDVEKESMTCESFGAKELTDARKSSKYGCHRWHPANLLVSGFSRKKITLADGLRKLQSGYPCLYQFLCNF